MALPTYVRTEWIDDTAPSLEADNLNKLEQGLYAVTEEVKGLNVPPAYVLPKANSTVIGGVKISVNSSDPDNIVGEIWVD